MWWTNAFTTGPCISVPLACLGNWCTLCQTLLGCSLTHDFDKHNYDSVCSGAEFLMIGLSQQNTTFRNPSRRLTSGICSCRLFATFFGELPAETLCEKKSVSSFWNNMNHQVSMSISLPSARCHHLLLHRISITKTMVEWLFDCLIVWLFDWWMMSLRPTSRMTKWSL